MPSCLGMAVFVNSTVFEVYYKVKLLLVLRKYVRLLKMVPAFEQPKVMALIILTALKNPRGSFYCHHLQKGVVD